MKYHKGYNDYIQFLDEIFPIIEPIEVVYRNIDVIEAILENNNDACVEELGYDLNLSEQRIRVKLRDLENEGLVKSKKEKKPNTSYNKKYYSTIVRKKFVEEFCKFLYCSKCGRRFSKFGGIIHYSIDNIRLFCTKQCRGEWCYESSEK